MDYNNIKLSIIIPVYNTEKYIQRCLDSVMEAIDDEMEVLIINDGSPDDSESIILTYLEKSNQLRYFKKENGGLSDVKNYGIERARGEYIIFLDSDDYIESDMYKKMLEVLEKDNSEVVVCDIRMVYENDSKLNRVESCNNINRNNIFFQIVDTPLMAASWNKIVKKSLYEGLDFPKGMNNEDISVTPIILGKAKKISIVNEPFYNYVQRSGSIQNSQFGENRFVILKTSKLALERAKIFDKAKQEEIKGSIYLHQILALALYSIRQQKFNRRKELLNKYMNLVETDFKDIFDNTYVSEMKTWGSIYKKVYSTMAFSLLKNKHYNIASIFFGVYNVSISLKNATKRLF